MAPRPALTPSPQNAPFVRREDIERALRAEVQKEPLVQSIMEVSRWLILGHLPRYARPEGLPSDPRAHLLQWDTLDANDLARLKVFLDTRFKLLGKVLPDLKAVEVTDTTPQQTLTDLELAARVAALVSRNKSPLVPSRVIDHSMPEILDAVLVEDAPADTPDTRVSADTRVPDDALPSWL